MEPGRSYALSEWRPVARLADGITHHRLNDDRTSSAELRTGDNHIQLAIAPVAISDVDNLPSLHEFAPSIIAECLTPLRAAHYGFELIVRTGERRYRSSALICAEMMLSARLADAVVPGDKQSEVERAFERGLLDGYHRDVADFRLRMRPIRDQLAAIRSSGYVPGWRLLALFSTFRDDDSGEWTIDPRPLNGQLEMGLVPATRRRGFRMTDLFNNSI